MKFNQRCILFLLACFWLLAIAPAASAGKTLHVGASPVITSSGIFLAQEEGFFKEFGLDVEITIFKKSGAPQTVLLSKGDLDVGGGSVDAGFWNAINQGIDIKLVADKGHIEKGASSLVLMVRKDHLDSGRYKSLSDLKGFTMALTTLTGTPKQIVMERFLQKGGLQLSDVKILKMSFPEMNMGFANKALDATLTLEPFVAKAELDGTAMTVIEAYEVYPDLQGAAIFYSPHFIKNNPKQAVDFMAAYLKGVRVFRDAFINGKRRQEITNKLKKYIKIQDDAVWENIVIQRIDPNGYIRKDALLNDIKWYKEKGYINKIPNVDQYIDFSFIEKALKIIGKQ